MVKWQGYPDSDNTWELMDKLKCYDLISMYESIKKVQTFKAVDENSSMDIHPPPVENIPNINIDEPINGKIFHIRIIFKNIYL